MTRLYDVPHGQIQQFERMLAEAGLNAEMVEAVLKNRDAATGVVQFLRDLLTTNPFASELVSSNYAYPEGYAPKDLAGQLAVLAKLYPDFDISYVAAPRRLPEGAELFQLVPKLSSVARANGIEDPYGTGYGRCLEIMLGHLNASRKFHNYREGRLGPDRLRLLPSTRKVLEKLEASVSGDFVVIPMQSGMLYRGSSARRSRWEIEHAESPEQWSLPAWVVGHHLLTHPERLSTGSELWLDCPGDEYFPDADGQFEDALDFGFRGGTLSVDYGWADDASDGYGAASGFLPE